MRIQFIPVTNKGAKYTTFSGKRPVDVIRKVNKFINDNPGVQFSLHLKRGEHEWTSIAAYRRAYYA